MNRIGLPGLAGWESAVSSGDVINPVGVIHTNKAGNQAAFARIEAAELQPAPDPCPNDFSTDTRLSGQFKGKLLAADARALLRNRTLRGQKPTANTSASVCSRQNGSPSQSHSWPLLSIASQQVMTMTSRAKPMPSKLNGCRRNSFRCAMRYSGSRSVSAHALSASKSIGTLIKNTHRHE